jgi:alcohol dehydrogenase YqhD (iron-dependent ADH family)
MNYCIAKDNSTHAKFAAFGREIFQITEVDDTKAAHLAVQALVDFYKSIDCPLTLQEVKINDKDKVEIMAEQAVKHGKLEYAYVALDKAAVVEILNACFEAI